MCVCVVKMTFRLANKKFEFSHLVHVILMIASYLVYSLAIAAPPPLSSPSPPVLQNLLNQSKAIEQEKLDGKSSSGPQKTANLVPLINETLKINNKTTTAKSDNGVAGPLDGDKRAPPNFRDDWTFDRVEYDLIEFLQELNARYQQNGTLNQAQPDPAASLDERLDRLGASSPKRGQQQQQQHQHQHQQRHKQDQLTEVEIKSEPVTKETVAAECTPPVRAPSSGASGEVVTIGSIEQVKRELELVRPIDELHNQPEKLKETTRAFEATSTTRDPSVAAAAAAAVTLPANSQPLPISLASGDHDISESTWQYGIFDRFTRPRASTTSTASPAEVLAASATNANLDVRSFNTDECGLRNYRAADTDADYFPSLGAGLSSAGSQLDNTDEITKELSQRRQRPPLGGSYFSSHKKYHLTSGPSDANSGRDELDQEPPYDRNGEPAHTSDSSGLQVSVSKYPTEKGGGGGGGGGASSSLLEADLPPPPPPPGDSDFNLALRRQWMQQQLGSTLQILGYNSTADGPYNQSLYGTGRENMMKMSAGKLAKSYAPNLEQNQPSLSATAAAAAAGHSVDFKSPGERDLKARQDDLKLEARVIGGNDARLGDSPWSASLQALVSRPGTGGVEYRHYCGGTIISEYYILTAAHCLDFMIGRESRLFVVIGDLNWRMSTASLHGRRFGIEKLLIHGGYKSTAFGHDIGLIRTKESMRPLKINGRYIINSVCLPERNVEHTGEAELVGWGLFSNRNEMADSLQIADVPILPRPLCVDLYRRRTGLIQWLIGIELITEKQVCAGTFGRGICQGDSGSALVYNEKKVAPPDNGQGTLASPLLTPPETLAEMQPDGKADIRRLLRGPMVRDQQQRATIIGTVAFGGIRRCSYQSLPGVYMQTSKYLDWILPRIQSA